MVDGYQKLGKKERWGNRENLFNRYEMQVDLSGVSSRVLQHCGVTIVSDDTLFI